MAAQLCCVDRERPGTKTISGRWFCDEHYAKATYKRGGVWRSEVLGIIALIVFVAIVVGLDAALKPQFTQTGLMVVGLVLAIVPALLWLFVFYQQDRLEPEPVGQVARMFVIGLALAGALGIPLTDQLFRAQDWLYADTLTNVLGSILLIGGVEAFIVYATVRYFIFDSPEFDERTDGVIYGTAAGLGVATALNLQFILGSGGAALGTGEIFVVEVALAQAAFGGLLGYFLGRARLEQEPVWWLPLGLLVTAVLNGAFNLLRGQLDPGTFGAPGDLPSFTGLLLAGALAVIVAVVLYLMVNRDISHALSGKQAAPVSDPTQGDRQANYAVAGVFVVLLLVSALIWNNAVNGVMTFDKDGFRGSYPAGYGTATAEGDVLRVVDNLGTGAEFSIVTRPLESGQDAKAIASQLGGERSTDYAVYKTLDASNATVNGKDALVQRFSVVDSLGFSGALPEVIEGVDYIFVEGSRAVIVTLMTSPDDIADVEPRFARFLNGLSF
jgi:RsiW-degrading membrane proteinase PrsW (M82 family)